jgi:glycosyltransferase involved in cell wall biosynthesis
MTDDKVAILLTTYNSSKYLKIQLDSIIAQTDVNWQLYIRDDGSSDDTLRLIDAYVANHKNITFLKDQYSNMGAMNSFMHLLSVVEAKYYMFCDHDDYWLETKIELSKNAILSLDKLHPNTPLVVHTDLCVVDDNLTVKHNSFWKYSRINPDLLTNKEFMQVFNCVTGCTMIFNAQAKAVSFPYPKNAPMHDWWVALRTIQTGIVQHLNTPTILYRQHENNEVGARDINGRYFWNKLLGIRDTLEGHRKQLSFLKSIKGHSVFKYYYYKIAYTILRNK